MKKIEIMEETNKYLDMLEESRTCGCSSLDFVSSVDEFYFTDEHGHSSFIATSVAEPDTDNLNKIEAFLTGNLENPFSKARQRYLRREYGLKRRWEDEYVTDGPSAFRILCAKYERARFFKSWGDLYFAMLDDRREWEYSWRKEVAI